MNVITGQVDGSANNLAAKRSQAQMSRRHAYTNHEKRRASASIIQWIDAICRTTKGPWSRSNTHLALVLVRIRCDLNHVIGDT